MSALQTAYDFYTAGQMTLIGVGAATLFLLCMR